MVKKSCENCNSKSHFENKDYTKSYYYAIDYFCVISGEFIKDLNDLCECWVKSKDIVREIVNKECDRLERLNETFNIA